MIDHIVLNVNDFQKSLDFYDQTLAELGYERLMMFEHETGKVAGYGKNNKPSFWFRIKTGQLEATSAIHIAFEAPDIDAVQRWYTKCIELGGKDNGQPGPRPHYHPGYYGAFITDANGWNIEAVFHGYKG